MGFLDILSQMMVLFAIVVIGFIGCKLKLLDADFNRKLSSLVVNITAPCLILSSVMSGDRLPDRELLLPLVVIAFATYAFLIMAGWFVSRLFRLPVQERGIFHFMLSFGNVGFIGFPVVAAIFGHEAIFYASVLIIPSNLLIFVLGTKMVTGGRDASRWNWRMFFSPFMVATYISMLIVILEIDVSPKFGNIFVLTGGMTVPSALLIIGSSLAMMPVRNMLGTFKLYLMCLFRLLIMPVVVLAVCRLAGVDAYIAGINAVLAGMPVASFGTMFCLKYGVDERRMTQGTFLSTFLSMFSIPLLSMWL